VIFQNFPGAENKPHTFFSLSQNDGKRAKVHFSVTTGAPGMVYR
jgi:hypothetical protein